MEELEEDALLGGFEEAFPQLQTGSQSYRRSGMQSLDPYRCSTGYWWGISAGRILHCSMLYRLQTV
jgi:hypothetical protein